MSDTLLARPRRARAIGSHQSAAALNEEWLTPPAVIDSLGGAASFDLDPCAPIARPWPTARAHFTIEDDGLVMPWSGRVWLNPPYTNAVIGRWLGRLADHGRGTALIFARTETENFFRHVWERATALLFFEGRLHFHYVDGTRAKANAGAPSVLCAYGPSDADVLASCGISGQFVPLRLPRAVAVLALDQTWTEAVMEVVSAARGPVRLDDLYRAFAQHPKARGKRNARAKIRQTLQRGPFRRVRRGEWERLSA